MMLSIIWTVTLDAGLVKRNILSVFVLSHLKRVFKKKAHFVSSSPYVFSLFTPQTLNHHHHKITSTFHIQPSTYSPHFLSFSLSLRILYA